MTQKTSFAPESRMKRFISFLLILILCIVPLACRNTVVYEVPVSGMSEIPEYAGIDYVVLHDNYPDFSASELVRDPYVHFSKRDSLGRTGPGMACLGPETLPTESRKPIGMIRPSGWHTSRYNGLIEGGYLYNRSHVIGFLLCGDSATPENLFTGTRYLNATSMLTFETAVEEYITATGNHVIYRCSPKYIGNNLLASGVQIEAFSVEDGGRLHFNVFVFNIQPGVNINYANGDNRRNYKKEPSPLHPEPVTEYSFSEETQNTDEQETEEEQDAEVTYILNTSRHRFHYPSCPSVQDIKEKNRENYYGTREELIDLGYVPCGRCNP